MIFLSKDLKIIEKKNFHLRRNGSFSVPLVHKELGTLKITHLYHKCPKKHEKIQEFIRKRTFQVKNVQRLESQYL